MVMDDVGEVTSPTSPTVLGGHEPSDQAVGRTGVEQRIRAQPPRLILSAAERPVARQQSPISPVAKHDNRPAAAVR